MVKQAENSDPEYVQISARGGDRMAKYLFLVRITNVRTAGTPSNFGADWEASLTEAVANVSGAVEAIYFAFGDTDIYMVADVPDEASAAALSLGISLGREATVVTVLLFTPARVQLPTWSWRPPGT
jgi:uncharacterized protein with GYD domain